MSSIFEIAVKSTKDLGFINHPLLVDNNYWIDALLEKNYYMLGEEERNYGERPRFDDILGNEKRKRAESDVSGYEEEANNAINSSYYNQDIGFDLCKLIDDLLYDDIDDIIISEKVDELLGVTNSNYDPKETAEVSEKWTRYFEAEEHSNTLDLLEAGLYKLLVIIE
jgi:hypothetical protein